MQTMALCTGVLDRDAVGALHRAADQTYARLDALPAGCMDERVSRLQEDGVRYVPSAHSFGLETVMTASRCTSALPRALRDEIRTRLGGPFTSVDALCWVRRQAPASQRAAHHHPHSWHQDGACGHDYAQDASQGLVPMVTLWVPLTACGVHAPGLELVAEDVSGLVDLHALADPLPTAPRWAPSMAPGDVLLMEGSVVHRTHVTPAMGEVRTSIELRYARTDRWPARLPHLAAMGR